MLVDSQEFKALRREARRGGDNFIAKTPSIMSFGISDAYYQGTELPDGSCSDMAFGYIDRFALSVASGWLVIPHDEVVWWGTLRTADEPGHRSQEGHKVRSALGKVVTGALGGALAVASDRRRERQDAERPAIAVSYRNEDAEGTVYLTFYSDKKSKRLIDYMREVLGPETKESEDSPMGDSGGRTESSS